MIFQLVGAALSVLWMVVHSVHGIMFKDLKQILRKEQCDASILLTANVPSAKKIIVHGPDGKLDLLKNYRISFQHLSRKLTISHFLFCQIHRRRWHSISISRSRGNSILAIAS